MVMNSALIIPIDQEVEMTEQRLLLNQPDQVICESEPEGKLIHIYSSHFWPACLITSGKLLSRMDVQESLLNLFPLFFSQLWCLQEGAMLKLAGNISMKKGQYDFLHFMGPRIAGSTILFRWLAHILFPLHLWSSIYLLGSWDHCPLI